MPKISVHLEADSAEEFRELLTAFHVELPERWSSWQREPKVETPSAPIEQTKPEQVSTRKTEETPEPVTVRVPEAERATTDVLVSGTPPEKSNDSGGDSLAAAAEPAQPRRGRPRKEKPAAETAAVADVAKLEAEPQPQPEPAPVKAKPKIMPHAKPENGAATRQDLLDAFSEYVQRYGASFGFSDISQLLQKNLGDGVRKASDVPEDKLPVAIGAIKTAIADNPFNRKRDYA